MTAKNAAVVSSSLADLPARIRGNAENYFTYDDAEGLHCSISFSQLYENVCVAVDRLVASGIPLEEGRRIVIVGNPGYDWLLAGLACLFRGATVVALPESLSDQEISDSLRHITLHGVIAEERFLATENFIDLPKIAMPGLGSGAKQGLGTRIDRMPSATLIAFTSGSTATTKIKAFEIDLESTRRFIGEFIREFGVGRDDVWVVCHSFSHIVHFEYVLGGLIWGYNVSVTNVFNLLMNGASLQPSVLVSVPSVYQQIAEQIRRRLPDAERQGDGDGSQAGAVGTPLRPEAAAVMGTRLKMMLIGAAPSSQVLKQFLLAMGLPLFEGYGLSETNMISCNLPHASRPGTVGSAWPGVEIMLDGEGQILAKVTGGRTCAYINVPDEENALAFAPGGWVRTGDLGEINEGYLSIIGRKKEIAVTDGGKKINLAALEARLRDASGVEHVLVIGDRRPFPIALFAPDGIRTLPESQALETILGTVNDELPIHERVLRFIRLEQPLSIDDGTLTLSGKPRRARIQAYYSHEIESCYG